MSFAVRRLSLNGIEMAILFFKKSELSIFYTDADLILSCCCDWIEQKG